MKYVFYAREFGWTPEQVDGLPLSLEPWILPIQGVIEADIARRDREAAEANSAGAR